MAHRKSSDDEKARLKPWEEVVLGILGALLTYLLHTTRSNPADPAAAEALRQLVAFRRQLQTQAGVEDTPLTDPHGLLGTNADKPEGK